MARGRRAVLPRLIVAGVVAVVLAVAAAAGPAAAQGVPADARREGKVVWYTASALPVAERIARMFEQAQPGIRVEVHRSGSERLLQRIMQELSAGLKNCDVFNSSDVGHYVLLKKKGVLARYVPPGADRFPAAFRDADGLAFGWRAYPIVIPYNTRQVPAADAPKTWKDLLDPKWKGRLVTAHPGYSGTIVTHILALSKLYGWDYFKQLALQKPLMVQSAFDPIQIVASGERAVGVNAVEYFLYTERKKGNPLGIVYPADGMPLVISSTAVMASAPHPAAARLFTDFIFSRETLQYLADAEGLYVPHPDVTYPADKPKFSDLKILPVSPEEMDRRTDEIKKRFVELFGA